ncbi:MAG: carboxypeptidase regulatory-like domain-containing protein [Candidatus Peribacteria bacterium]|jgi:hypothetical protein|nr:carboxypeptidase regulatory-like domain-containing protein [Candidatus Peribacteria bacterium]
MLKGTIALDTTVPLQAIEVYLKAPNGNIVQTTYTDTSGAYAFTQVEAGNYSISYMLPSYYTAERAEVGSLGGLPSTGQLEVGHIPVQFDQQGLDYNFVLQALTGQIGGIIYQVNTKGEFLRPSSGVVVYLHDAPVIPFALSLTTGDISPTTGDVSPITGDTATGNQQGQSP